MGQFLDENKVEYFVSDADVIVINSGNQFFIMLMLKFAEWVIASEHDRSINPNADGSKYHS